MKKYPEVPFILFQFKQSDYTKKYKISQEIFRNFDFFLHLIDNIYVSRKKAKQIVGQGRRAFFH